jgi:hypothetical protein
MGWQGRTKRQIPIHQNAEELNKIEARIFLLITHLSEVGAAKCVLTVPGAVPACTLHLMAAEAVSFQLMAEHL